MINKKGKDGSSVAVVVLVIAFFMVLYILFIPPEEREELLGLSQNNSSTTSVSGLPRIELFAESPGTVSPSRDFGTKHSIPSLNLFVKTEPKLDKLAESIVVKKGLFTRSSPILKFRTDELPDTSRASLNFYIREASGELRIKLNNQIIYSEEVKTVGAKLIDINKNLLKDQNELEFSVSSGFFTVNTYALEDVILKQEYERINSKEERSFVISEEELKGLSKAVLSYTQVCNENLNTDSTQLDININDLRASSQNIKCVTTNQDMDVDLRLLRPGKNTIVFTLEEGDFSFNQITLETVSKESKFLTYQFNIPSNEFNKIESGERRAILDVFLSQERRDKNARFVLNNNDLFMKT